MKHSEINWDEPSAIDFKAAVKVFTSLAQGYETMMPEYDFVKSVR